MLSEGPSKSFLGAICISLAVVLASVLLYPPPQRLSQAPQIEAHQDSNSSLKRENDSDDSKTAKDSRRNSEAQKRDEEASEYWFIFGRRLKITDTLLVIFTFTLWWSTNRLWNVTDRALRSTERSLEATERSYIFHGYDPIRYRNNQPHIVLKMMNAGRMPGRIVEVGWRFLPQTFLPPTREGRDWEWNVIPYDFLVRPGQAPTIGGGTFVGLEGDHVFVTYITYEDLFSRKHHTSWMGMRIRPGHPEPETQAGGAAWNDWT